MSKKIPRSRKQDATSESQNGTHHWKPFLNSYRQAELSVLTFENDPGIYAAIDLVWQGKLHGMPFALAGGDSIVIPADAVHHFAEAGLTFEESKLLTRSDLTPEEDREYRAWRARL